MLLNLLSTKHINDQIKNMKSPFSFTRRAFVKNSAIAVASLPLASSLANRLLKKQPYLPLELYHSIG